MCGAVASLRTGGSHDHRRAFPKCQANTELSSPPPPPVTSDNDEEASDHSEPPALSGGGGGGGSGDGDRDDDHDDHASDSKRQPPVSYEDIHGARYWCRPDGDRSIPQCTFDYADERKHTFYVACEVANRNHAEQLEQFVETGVGRAPPRTLRQFASYENYAAFRAIEKQLPKQEPKHFYEVARDGRPCRLHFHLEWTSRERIERGDELIAVNDSSPQMRNTCFGETRRARGH